MRVTRRVRVWAAAGVLIAALAGLGPVGCTTVPATGERTFTGFMTTADEVKIGLANHPQIVKEFGGEVKSPEVRRYVDSVGKLLSQVVERKDLNYKFTVLNSPIVNAFATPGGYVYITRGLMALADDEAQLAAVMAHELGHLTALHHARRQGQSLLANILLTGVGIAAGGEVAQLGQLVAVGALQAYSRENEYEADDLGVRYTSRVGFDPQGMAQFLTKLRANSQLEARLRGESPDAVDQFNYLATHPAPIERVRRASANAARVTVANSILGRDVYLSKLDGMLYGDDPDQGFIKGRVFAHPRLRFRFEVPPGFRLFNSQAAVIAFGPDKSRIMFDQAKKPSDGPMRFYLTDIWGKALPLTNVETIRINGLEAATAVARGRANGTPVDVRLVALRVDLQTIYRFLFLTPTALTQKLATDLRRTTFSFRVLTAAEARALKPHRLRIITVRAGDTIDSLARRMPFEEFRVERFRTLNGLQPGQKLAPGQKLKMVVE